MTAAAWHQDPRWDETPQVDGHSIQDDHDHGMTWAQIAVAYDISKSAAQKHAREYRKECERRAHRNQMTLFQM